MERQVTLLNILILACLIRLIYEVIKPLKDLLTAMAERLKVRM